MDNVIENAIKSARYNEAVVVSLSSGEDPNTTTAEELVLVAQLDVLNGGIIWNRIEAPDHSDSNSNDVGIVQHLRTKRWVLPMLNDHFRNNLYSAAIQEACKVAWTRFKESSRPSISTIHALDIGSGTGLLAMITARYMRDEMQSHVSPETDTATTQETCIAPALKVTSLEMSSAMARLARLTIASNHESLPNVVDVVEAHSCDIDLDQKAHICTSELLESGLLGEGVLPALRDAWKRHLDPNAVIVPQRARVFAQVLEGRKCIGNYWGPHQSPSSCGREEALLNLSLSADVNDVMIGDVHNGIIIPLHAEQLLAPTGGHQHFLYDHARKLSEPFEVLAFDFSNSDGLPDESGRSQTISFLSTGTGVAHGVLFWWELDLWDGLTYSTESGKQQWQDHWHQCLYVFPIPHSQCPRLKVGESSNLVVRHDDYRISFEIAAEKDEQNVALKRIRSERPDAVISPQRALQLNDVNRIAVFRSAIAFAIAAKGVDSIVLDLSDFSLGAILAALEGARYVVSLESSTGAVAQTSARVAQLANGLPRAGASFQILQCYAEQLALEAIPGLGHDPIEIIVAEPYYEILEGWHLQEAMNFSFLVHALKLRGVISETATIVPAFATIKAAAISCAELWRAYARCGDLSGDGRVCGFNHDIVNSYGVKFEDREMNLPTWQYDVSKLTDNFELGRIPFEGTNFIPANGERVSIPFTKAGICHGLKVWIEYSLRISAGSEEACFSLISTEDKCHQQIVRLLSVPATVDETNRDRSRFECQLLFGELSGVEYHSFRCYVVLED